MIWLLRGVNNFPKQKLCQFNTLTFTENVYRTKNFQVKLETREFGTKIPLLAIPQTTYASRIWTGKVKGRSFQSWSHEILHVARIARCTAQPRFRPEWDPSLPLAKEFCSKIREEKNVTDSSQSVALAVSPSVFIFQTGRNNYSRQHQLLSMKIIFKVCSLRQETTTTKRKA